MTRDQLLEELRKLDGQFVGVAFHPTEPWEGSVLHAQGRIRSDFVDQPENGIAFGIGKPRRRTNDWAEFQIIWDDVESAAWRDDVLPTGRSVLVICLRGGSRLTVAS